MGKPQTGQERDTKFYDHLLRRYGESFVRACDELSQHQSTAEGEYFTTLVLQGLDLANLHEDSRMGGAYYRTEKFLPFYKWFKGTPVYRKLKEMVEEQDKEFEELSKKQ